VGRDSSVGIATNYGLDGSGDRIPERAGFSASFQNGPDDHPASYTMVTGSFLGVKLPGGGDDAEVKERAQLYLYSTYGPSCPVVG
jgi:hypothetical protein